MHKISVADLKVLKQLACTQEKIIELGDAIVWNFFLILNVVVASTGKDQTIEKLNYAHTAITQIMKIIPASDPLKKYTDHWGQCFVFLLHESKEVLKSGRSHSKILQKRHELLEMIAFMTYDYPTTNIALLTMQIVEIEKIITAFNNPKLTNCSAMVRKIIMCPVGKLRPEIGMDTYKTIQMAINNVTNVTMKEWFLTFKKSLFYVLLDLDRVVLEKDEEKIWVEKLKIKSLLVWTITTYPNKR